MVLCYAPNNTPPVKRLLPALVVAATLLSCTTTPSGPPELDYPMDLTLPRLGGGTVRLSRYAGEVVVVSFFATWCMPCVAEVPIFNTLHRKNGVRVIGVGMDREGARVLEPFRDEFVIDYIVAVADDPVFEGQTPFGPIRGLPTNFVLDQRGRVVAAYAGLADPERLQQLIDDVLAGRVEGIDPRQPPPRR